MSKDPADSARQRYKKQAREYRAYLSKITAIDLWHVTRSRNVDPAEAVAEYHREISRISRVPRPAGYSPPPTHCKVRNIILRRDKARKIRELRAVIIRRANELIFDLEHGYDFKIQYVRSTIDLAKELLRLTKGY